MCNLPREVEQELRIVNHDVGRLRGFGGLSASHLYSTLAHSSTKLYSDLEVVRSNAQGSRRGVPGGGAVVTDNGPTLASPGFRRDGVRRQALLLVGVGPAPFRYLWIAGAASTTGRLLRA